MSFKKFINSNKVFVIYIGLSVLLVFCFSVLLVNKIYNQPQARIITEQREKPIINKDTKINREVTYLCGDKLTGEIPATDLLGLDYSGLLKRFPKENGWHIDDSIENIIKITKAEKMLCPLHKNYRHLASLKGYLAIYEGPLGFNELVLQQEKIKISVLPEELRHKLEQALSFDKQAEEVKSVLKRELEFCNEAVMQEALEGLNEYNR